jgi:hypothetical protein
MKHSAEKTDGRKMRRPNKIGFRSVVDDGRTLFATIFGAGSTIEAVIPLNAPFGRAGFSTGRDIMVSNTFNALVGIDIVDLFAGWVIVLVNDRFHRTLVDAGSAADACIGNDYSHFFSFKIWYVKL